MKEENILWGKYQNLMDFDQTALSLDTHQPKIGVPHKYPTLSNKKAWAPIAKKWEELLRNLPEKEIGLPLKKEKEIYAKAVQVREVNNKYLSMLKL